VTGSPAGPVDAGMPSAARIAGMHTRLAIGDFSRMTHLSVKALRHYHDVGLLEPAEIDPSSGYRFYEPGQLPIAQVIRRFRDLDMPLEEIRAMLEAPDVETRNKVIVAHMQRMEAQLAITQAAVTSLRSLLERPPARMAVEHRSAGVMRALAIAERVTEAELVAWWSGAFTELDAALRSAGVVPAGPRGALYPAELFEQEVGTVVAYVPVPAEVDRTGRARMTEIPAAELAVAVHRGPFGDLDQTYSALGMYVTEREIGVDGPIREVYLVTPFDTSDESEHVTEVCWPVFRTAPEAG
jgi:DNA-binding transcriptional MerR regulator/effector-binding domain-containing protein